MLAFFAIFPPKEITGAINELRKKYDNSYHRLAPHITIVPPFSPRREMVPAIEQLERILKILHPFEIEIDGVGCFKKNLNSVCYLDVMDSLELDEIQNITTDILADYGAKDSDKQKFHITITKRLTNFSAKKITSEIERLHFKDSFLVKYLAYCVIEKNEPWQIKELIPIGAIKNARNNSK